MKKLLTLMFTFALAFTLAMPVFAQDAAAGASQDSSAPKKEKKAKKEKKPKKEKKSDAMAPKADETK